MTAIMNDRPVNIRSPSAIRPWQHVLEPLNGYLRLAEQLWDRGPELGQSWNFGPNSENAKNVLWIVKYLTNAWGKGARWEADSASVRLTERTC